MRKRIAALILSFVLLCSACAGRGSAEMESTVPTSIPTAETTGPFDLTAYQSLVSSCVDKMDLITDLYVIMADYESSLWEAYNQFDVEVSADKLAQEAWTAAEESSFSKAKVKQEQDAIMQLYKEIVSTEVYGGEGKALEEVFNQYFDTYLALLNLVNNPVSEYDTFVQNLGSYSSTIETCKTKLEVLLP